MAQPKEANIRLTLAGEPPGDIESITVRFRRPGAGPRKDPKLIVREEFVADPDFKELLDCMAEATNQVLSHKLDDNALAENQDVNHSLDALRNKALELIKGKGTKIAYGMLGAAHDEIVRMQEVQELQPAQIDRWEKILRNQIQDAIDNPPRKE